MVVVVPAFAHGEHRAERIVFALVLGLERRTTEQVTDGIHAPGAVMHKKHSDESAPQQTCERTPPRSCDGATERRRDQQPDRDPDKIITVDRDHLPAAQ